ncbi:Protein kinase [Seminavis robusta]|uniref:Protein kinase n=1 Tax=Seminavis robusta TaxID=568900 RepID=A0A9N8DJ39_9STRA|nr:Protein kinase [Seminavis robusta]|eukprot:Sro110_g054980.1 Protein kinase (422) ;mRNA; f:82088-83582
MSSKRYDRSMMEDIGRRAWKTASRAAKHMSKHSKIVNPSMEKCIPRFERGEVVLGEMLGSGGFNDVFEVARIDLVPDVSQAEHAKKISSPLQSEHRAFVSKHVYRESSQNCRYAVKFLSVDTIEDPNRFCTGAADLVVEAKFLASLNHPNIIRLRGMAAAGTSGFATMNERGYFLLLDRLQCTLESKIDDWKELDNTLSPSQKRAFLADRLHVSFDVCASLEFLHSHDIIYRDLKPDNIGFDIRGDVKLFDFGLAKELDASMKFGCTELYELSGNTGSLRYMSPEVARSEPYNLTADVYSFGLLLWQICSLQLPYDGMNRQDHSELVVHGNERPQLDSNWSTPLRILMKRAWEPDPLVRPSMDSIYKILKREICALRDGDESGLEHTRRRSTFVLNRPSQANHSGNRAPSRSAAAQPISED